MASRRATALATAAHATPHASDGSHAPGRKRLAQLWQLPLLLVSLGLFSYAAYLFIDPRGGPSADEKIRAARAYLGQERHDAALQQLNKLLASERLTPRHKAQVHLLLAEALEMGVKHERRTNPVNHARIIEQTRLAVGSGAQLDARAYRRLGESFEAVSKPADALENYRRAIALDAHRTLRLQRKVIDLQLDQEDYAAAGASLDEYLNDKSISDAERAWAMGEKAQILIDSGKFAEARLLLDEARRLAGDAVAQGTVNYRLGYCAYKLNSSDEAERYLRVAREQLRVQHPLDAEAAYLLGRIFQEKDDAEQAASFYQSVLVSHIDSRVAPLARLGRGMCRLMLKEDDAALTDLHDVVNEVATKPSRARHKDAVIDGLQHASKLLAARGNHQGALEVLAYEQQLVPEPPAGFFSRLGVVYEQRADQVEKTIPGAAEADRIRRTNQVRDLRTKAGDAYVAYSQKLTLADDAGYGEAMWRGIELYDRAGNVNYVISALELFVAERPDDALAPEALLRLGRAYQAAGEFDKAIAAFQRNQFRYPQSLAASKTAVPLAQAYMAKGPDAYNKAEGVLLGVVNNNPLITPEAEEFKQAVFELAQLYYRTNRFEEAVNRLEEFTQRYPDDARTGQLVFLMADSYRKSGSALDVRLAHAEANADGAIGGAGGGGDARANLSEAESEKKDRLTKARQFYDKVIEYYRAHAPVQDVDRLYLKLSHFYRADCMFDLGNFAEAVKLYETAAFRYQDDPSALAAHVQIVNAYCALGKLDEAKTANERAKYLLKKIPEAAFDDGSFAMPKEYYLEWLKWTSQAGLWQGGP
jgi:tetratricopeptide (TPR) repeat protein